jgi:cytochrome P450
MNNSVAAGPCRAKSQHSETPPAVRSPKLVQGVEFAVFRRSAMRRWIRRHGRAFEISVPFFGSSVVISDPALVRTVCAASAEQLIDVQPNMSNLFGPGSVFALDGDAHRHRRRLLAPALHGRSLRSHEEVVEDETLRETAKWPQQTEIRTLEPMNRITMNVILRIIFGSGSTELEELRRIVPPFMKLGQRMAFVPRPRLRTGHHSPWGRLDRFREVFDRIVFAATDKAAADPHLSERTDILALLLRSRFDDGTRIPRTDICDEVLTLIGAGHETTASALGWLFERLRRHPDVVAELVREVDENGGDFRRATILELLRVRPVIDVAGRRVAASHFDLGEWRIPHGRTVLVRIADLHQNPDVFAHPERFDPYRFLGTQPPSAAWLPFGGGARRCIGAAFAITEMDVVLRTVLENFRIHTDDAADEKSTFQGVAHVPRLGGRVVVGRRG